MNKIKLIIMVLFLSALSGYSATLLDLNFESDTLGAQPTSPGQAPSPAVNTSVNFITVIGSPTNTAGTGKGVELVDESASIGTRLEYELSSPQSAIRFDFSFSPLKTDGSGANYFNGAVAIVGGSTGSSANRFCALRLYENGTVRFNGGNPAGSVGAAMPVALGSLYKVSMFLNDGVAAVTYIDPNGVDGNVLSADFADFWLDGVKIGSGALLGGGAGISAGTNGLGRVGFGSTTAAIQLRYAIDDLKVSQILPPAATGSLSLFFVGE